METDPSNLPDPEETIRIVEEAQVLDLDGALRALGEYLSFSQAWHPRLCLLWAAHAHLQEILPNLAIHLAFAGPKSSGKSEATKLMAELAGGRYLVGGTLAAFIRAFNDEERPLVGIDELDSNLRRLPELEAMMRAASDPEAVYLTSVPGKGRKWKSEDVRVGGPKVFNYRSQVEDALLSRTLVIEMPRQNDSGLVLTNLLDGNPPRHAVKDWLAREAEERREEWSRETVEARMRKPAFRERLDAFPTVLARQKQIAACLLIVSDVMGWDLEEAIREALQAKQAEEESYEDVREALAEVYRSNVRADGDECQVPSTEVLASVNVRRKETNLRLLSPYAFARIRRELGWQRGVNDKKDRRRGNKVILTFDKPVREALGIEPEEGDAKDEAGAALPIRIREVLRRESAPVAAAFIASQIHEDQATVEIALGHIRQKGDAQVEDGRWKWTGR